jgi:hypothetical protein
VDHFQFTAAPPHSVRLAALGSFHDLFHAGPEAPVECRLHEGLAVLCFGLRSEIESCGRVRPVAMRHGREGGCRPASRHM